VVYKLCIVTDIRIDFCDYVVALQRFVGPHTLLLLFINVVDPEGYVRRNTKIQ
jgi:hypothetical protein